jgi:hypothetical protein
MTLRPVGARTGAGGFLEVGEAVLQQLVGPAYGVGAAGPGRP